MSKPRAAQLDPSTFRREVCEPAIGQVQIIQQDHGMQIRAMSDLHIPCKCGRPLCGIEHELISDTKGYALYVRGVCLSCGLQQAMYLSEPAKAPQDYQTQLAARMAADVERVLAVAMSVREAALTPEEFTDELKETA
jgi:hypothetical protein